jgi:hypothetical protein
MMIAYASRTGNRRNLAVLRRADWRIMVSPKDLHCPEGFKYALDNGAWHAFQRQCSFDTTAFLAAYRKLGKGSDFVVLPDIVAGGLGSLEYSLSWLPRLGDCPNYLAVQDGMIEADIEPINGIDGIFIGGTTEWKEATMAIWGKVARQKRIVLHVGRVNSVRRIHMCEAAGVDSFDGSSVSRYAVTLPRLENARQQIGFKWEP